jgi:hypothetical protein
MVSPLETPHLSSYLSPSQASQNDIDVLNLFKYKFAIPMLRCLSILDRTLKM